MLDKGIVIAGDIQINLLDIELLTIKLRLLVASVDRAREMGINWWETDPHLSRERQSSSRTRTGSCASGSTGSSALIEERTNGGRELTSGSRRR